MTIQLRSHQFTLLPEKALLLDTTTLLLSDTHFGKSAAFRARGIPVPEGDTAADTTRIRELLEKHQPERLVIAGDFLHAPEGKTPEVRELLAEFFARLTCETHLVLGNHDLRAGSLPRDWPVRTHHSLHLGDVVVIHDPQEVGDTFAICGHLHPVARIRDGKKTAFRTPCFWLRDDCLVLPSFGSFTGGQVIHPAANDRVFAPLGDRVVEIPPEVL